MRYKQASAEASAVREDSKQTFPRICPGAYGEVEYSDLAGNSWVTRFTFELGQGNQIVCQHEAPERKEPPEEGS